MSTLSTAVPSSRADATARPRVGFLGCGWIGLARLRAVAESGTAEIVAFADPSEQAREATLDAAPGAVPAGSLDELLEHSLDAVVIATPSALHADQTITALEQGLAVFCQKPLARTATEAARVVAAARAADRPLGVDYSYRHTRALRLIRGLVARGDLGRVYAIELAFHNAYGPDKAWFRDARSSGGGCLIDLGVHLVDLALWLLDADAVGDVSARLYAEGRRLRIDAGAAPVEDHAIAMLDAGGATVHIACSWNLHAGRDACIGVDVHGTEGGATMRNVNGSFHDFEAHVHRGTRAERIASPPDEWGGRAIGAWLERVAVGAGFEDDRHVLVARTIDRVYGR